MRITVRVKPGSSREGVFREPDGTIVVRVHARPVDGEANEAVRAIVAKTLGVPRSQVSVLTPKGRTKTVDLPDAAAPGLAKIK